MSLDKQALVAHIEQELDVRKNAADHLQGYFRPQVIVLTVLKDLINNGKFDAEKSTSENLANAFADREITAFHAGAPKASFFAAKNYRIIPDSHESAEVEIVADKKSDTVRTFGCRSLHL